MADKPSTKPLVRVLEGGTNTIPPIWLMRQVGRYLPEYRAHREKCQSFLDLCFDPKLDRQIDVILETFAARPFVFNLEHGILPSTPIAHVERLIKRVRGI